MNNVHKIDVWFFVEWVGGGGGAILSTERKVDQRVKTVVKVYLLCREVDGQLRRPRLQLRDQVELPRSPLHLPDAEIERRHWDHLQARSTNSTRFTLHPTGCWQKITVKKKIICDKLERSSILAKNLHLMYLLTQLMILTATRGS